MASISQADQKSKKKRSKKKGGGGTTQKTTEETANTAAERQQTASQPLAESDDSEPEDSNARPPDTSPGTVADEEAAANLTNGAGANMTGAEDAAARFDALVRDRDALRAEVTQLRRSLEELQSKHESDLEAVQNELQETQGEKEQAEEQYQTLLGKVNTIRSQLGERLKADAEDLAQARTRIDELEELKSDLQERYTARSAEVEELTRKNQEQSKELSSLRNRLNLSQQNWLKEKDELIEQEAYVRDEFENAKQAMHDWEVLAMEERTIRRDLADRVADLEEQLASVKEAYEKAASERDSQSMTVDGLQKALQEIQTVRKQELKELVESSHAELETLRKQLHDVQSSCEGATAELDETKKELERALPFEKEVKEKNLLIGKLRHEAVTLNDHLTKALRFLKKGKPEDNVDRHIVTNHFLHFLALDRSDPKKFEVLQLISALLGWTDEQREQAGLARPGAGSATYMSLRLPGSPLVHRTPSTPALSNDHFPDSATSPASKETLAELWQHFLEQEAGVNVTKTAKSRTGSQSTAPGTPR